MAFGSTPVIGSQEFEIDIWLFDEELAQSGIVEVETKLLGSIAFDDQSFVKLREADFDILHAKQLPDAADDAAAVDQEAGIIKGEEDGVHPSVDDSSTADRLSEGVEDDSPFPTGHLNDRPGERADIFITPTEFFGDLLPCVHSDLRQVSDRLTEEDD